MQKPQSRIVRSLLLALALAFALPARAQTVATIAGSVVDGSTAEPLPFVSVAVWSANDSTLVTGALSDDAGAFRVEGVPQGQYRVVVSYVGYTTHTVPNVRAGGGLLNLGTIELEPDVAELEGVEVSAERARVQIQADRTVYNVADDPVVAGGSTTDALETIPSVEVDAEGNLSLRGAGNVAVLINGRPAPVSRDFLGAYLRQLPAGAVERIEVIPNPSAAYDPEGMGGIINIVLKRNTDLGLGGGVTAGLDTRGGYNATLNATLGRGPLNLAATYGFRHDERGGEGTRFRINRYLPPDSITTLAQESDDERGGFSHLVNLSADYTLGGRTTLSASGQAGVRMSDDTGLTTYLERDAADIPTLAYERATRGDGTGWNSDVRLGVSHDFAPVPTGRRQGTGEGERRGGGMRGPGGGGGRGGGQRGGGGAGSSASGHTLTLEARADASANEDDELFTEAYSAGGLRELQQTTSDEEEREASLEIDYVRPIGDYRLDVGFDGEFETTSNDFYSETADSTGVLVPDADRNIAFEYEEFTNAIYTQVARTVGPASVQVGLRAERAQTTFTLIDSLGFGHDFGNDYYSLFPSAFITYRVTENDLLRGSYSRRIDRVRTRFLNPFPRFDDPLNLSVGNPELRPQYIDAVELGYVRYVPWGSLTFTPYWRRTTDVIRRVQRVRDDGVTVSTFENLAESQSYGLEAVLSFDAGGALEGLRGFASLEGYRVATDGTDAQLDLSNDAFGWGGRLNLTYAIREGTDLQANINYRAPMETEQGRSGAMVFMNAALRQRLGDNASLSLRARDPLGLASFSSIVDEPLLYQTFERTMGGPQIGISFTYAIGQRPRQRDREQEQEEPVETGDPSFQ